MNLSVDTRQVAVFEDESRDFVAVIISGSFNINPENYGDNIKNIEQIQSFEYSSSVNLAQKCLFLKKSDKLTKVNYLFKDEGIYDNVNYFFGNSKLLL